MQTIHLRSRTGEDGILHLDIPVNFAETELEITVYINPVSSEKDNSEVEDFQKLDWHEFIERTAGALADDKSFFRHPQGEIEIRESLEGQFNVEMHHPLKSASALGNCSRYPTLGKPFHDGRSG